MLQQQHSLAETHLEAAMPTAGAVDGSTADSIHTQSSSDSKDDTVEMDTTRTMSHRNTSIMLDEDERMELRRIATAMSQRRRASVAHAIPESDSTVGLVDLALDPESKQFDMEKWLRGIVNELQKEGIALKRAGVAYQNLAVSGTGDAMQVQQTVGSFLQAPLRLGEHFSFGKKEPKAILHKSDGILRSGELLIVLGRPGSGCSTLLKTMTGQLEGLDLGDESRIHYNGIPQKEMMKEFKGETTYNQEVDKHFPHLTVGQTLEFAAAARTPSNRIQDLSRADFQKQTAKIVMAVCGLSHTYNTKVGNDFIRGVSGGERKRVSIAEMMLAGSPLAAWDNSTRGLDSATAFKFVNTLRVAANLSGSTHAVAIYQASQAIYDLFDKAVVLYEGRQIFFGPAQAARPYFEKMGWLCPQRQTTGDFLTSVTNPQERVAREGMENRVPRTAEDFEQYWLRSPEHEALQKEVQRYEEEFPVDANGLHVNEMRQGKNLSQAKHVRPESPYMISMAMQIRLTTKRAYQRMWNDLSATGTSAIINAVLALIIGSVFYGTPDTTDGFYSKGSVLFNAILLNALTAISEINSLYSQRPIVEKHASYAFYHPAAEAIAGIVADIPIKFVTSTVFNVIIYFLSGLRREAGAFFLFFLVSYVSTFVMSAIFRTLAAVTKTVSSAMTLAGVMVLALVMYAGFMIRVPQMHDWFSWLRWINPIYYAFEILIANEFHGQRYDCATFVPPYPPLQGDSWICSTVGAVAGQRWVSGDDFIETNYEYYHSHTWRNFGILLAFLFFFMIVYFVATEMNSATSSVAEVLVFRRGAVPGHLKNGVKGDTLPDVSRETNDNPSSALNSTQSDIFTWRDVKYDVDIKGTQRTLLNNVSGWVKPGTLTALMGVSGAGKTTLLDVLAQRTTTGVITGDMFVNGKPLNASFQRKTGYVQQQDLHLETATVRESLRFSAMLRQPATVSKQDKYSYVEDVIDMLNMRDFADAVVGIPGEGLNIEQRKLLTIGVELAARPKLLIFLDEPTSGLDSQSSWAICAFLRKLADAGQAVLCTVHQPSAILFQKFDRLLFLAAGGKTVYFGDIGTNSRTLLDYFELNGARHCDAEENPAEYMLDVVNQGTSANGQDWHSIWLASPERQGVMQHIEQIHAERASASDHEEAREQSEFAMSFGAQVVAVTTRAFQQYWRTPSYVFSKFSLGLAAGLFIGFSFFDTKGTLAGMQNVIFAVFMVTTMFSTLVQQIQPYFISQRALYEVRERPSKAYSWKAFIIASVCVEIPYQIITGIIMYGCLVYPVVGVQSSSRQGLVLLFIIQIFLYASSFAQMTIAALPDAQTASGVVTLLTLMSLTFCGVMQAPSALPGFWMFMYRVSPFTYWVGGIVSTLLHGRTVECSVDETSVFDPPQNQTCGDYLSEFLSEASGSLQNPDATEQCRYCSLTVADQYLSGSNIFYSERFRNFGIVWAFIFFNIFIAVATYYMFRVRTWNFKAFGKKQKA
ncbi:ABC-2 type transporter [Dactylonectria estremocensis]|uniref:ABC-2 type transporter n=1 Tax=Dactylonectria estremocensis TaxID=1079267 RepID=A0A9P9ET41_9HYPO|nr:ABC-2 type transporter [Dactylonectria estremocensis]